MRCHYMLASMVVLISYVSVSENLLLYRSCTCTSAKEHGENRKRQQTETDAEHRKRLKGLKGFDSIVIGLVT